MKRSAFATDRSLLFSVTLFSGKTIGQHGPLITFHKAKEYARIILADALKGNDLVADDRSVRDAPTMRELAADYLEQHAIPKKRARSVESDRSMIDRIILPRLGSKKVAEKRYAYTADSQLRAATERFGAKLDALHKRQEAEIIPIRSRR